MIKIDMPSSVHTVLDALRARGFEAYAVGGCVRDTILGRVPDDWDITTSALPMQVKQIFSHTVDTGLEHGTVTVLIGKNAHEVTTYRIDGTYEDGRHPKEVSFTSLLSEDLRRRDFTINAMAYNEEEGLIDLFGGLEDIERKMIRCVGNAEERFGEDALRILRAARFAAQLGFAIDPATLAAVQKLCPNLAKISAERINVELTKLLKSARPEFMQLCYDTGITRIVLPELDAAMKEKYPESGLMLGEHLIQSTRFVEADPVLRWTMLLNKLPEPNRILRRLKFDNDTIRQVKTLSAYCTDRRKPEETKVRRLLSEIGPEMTRKLLLVQRADALTIGTDRSGEELNRIAEIEMLCTRILERGDCYNLKLLAVTGADLIQAGVQPGKQMGVILNQLLEVVLEDPAQNTKEHLLGLIASLP